MKNPQAPAIPAQKNRVRKLWLCAASLSSGALLSACHSRAAPVAKPPARPISERILVDQFGWRADSRKVVVFAQPQKGQNAPSSYAPGPTFQLRQEGSNKVVFTEKVAPWKNGAVHSQSGDRTWHGDFSRFTAPGEYRVYDPKNKVESDAFRIDNAVFNPILRASLRTFYYQRCGTEITAEHGGNWTHAACHVGAAQDREAVLQRDGQAVGEARDVSGGWHDAGDHNKYVPFLSGTMWDLMQSYEFSPEVWDDAVGIPESGNGAPDILDELKWELDWLLKMQLQDGSVLNRVGALSYDNGAGPDADTQPRFYAPPTTWSTATFCGLTFHAARLFAAHEKVYPGYSTRLRQAAEGAWKYLELNPTILPADGRDGAGKMAAADAVADAADDLRRRISAAAEGFKTTGDARYDAFFRANFRKNEAREGDFQPFIAGRFDPSSAPDLTRAAFIYATARGANAPIVKDIRGAFKVTAEETLVGYHKRAEDPYLAFMWDGHYAWGSNQTKAGWARMAILAVELGVAPARSSLYREIAGEYVHYLHGRNPLGIVYLQNMGEKGGNLGAAKSVMDAYHGWFNKVPRYNGPDSEFGSAPGFLVGGPNQFFTVEWIAPPFGEPPMKAFKDWSGAWNAARNANEDSWAVTEPAIYYQAAYTLALSYFCAPAKAP